MNLFPPAKVTRGVVALVAILAACGTENVRPPANDLRPQESSEPLAFSVLVFTKTTGFRHDSIPVGVEAIRNLGIESGFAVNASEDASFFTPEGLSGYRVIVFLSTTGTLLDDSQKSALQEFIRGGGGFVGIHSATDTEHEWPWYAKLIGTIFRDHPAIQEAVIHVTDPVHPSTEHLPSRWVRTDEWYNFRSNPRGKVRVLAVIDETTYRGGNHGADHPIAWCSEFEGGRSWYTAGGHTSETFSEPEFLQHLRGGIRWAAGELPAPCIPN